MTTHIVLLRFPDDMSGARIDELLAPFLTLPDVIPGLVAVSAGSNTSPEGLHNGYRHGLVMHFSAAVDRDAYLTHPAHLRVAEPLVAALAHGVGDVAVFDLESKT